ncbi:transcription regulator, partial [gut metagenome]
MDEMEREVRDLELGLPSRIRVGALAPYRGDELNRCLAAFAKSHPRVTLDVALGSHEFLWDGLQHGRLDVALCDQRRAPSSSYEYAYLGQSRYWIEASEASPYAWALELSPMQLTDVPIILVASNRQREAERDYCTNVLGFRSEFLFVPSI